MNGDSESRKAVGSVKSGLAARLGESLIPMKVSAPRRGLRGSVEAPLEWYAILAGMNLGPYYANLAASDRLRVLVEELRWSGPTREILGELGCLAESLEEAERALSVLI